MSYITLSVEDGLNAFLRQAVREQKISFRLKEPELSGWALTEKAIEESENNIGIHGPFTSFEEMTEDILNYV